MVHWPGDPDVTIQRVFDLERGDPCNVSTVSMSLHVGTHMDAPLHYLPNGLSLDRMPPDATIGPCTVIEIANPVSITREELEAHSIESGSRVLFKTRSASRCWSSDQFEEDFVYISTDAAHYLVGCGVRAVGIDYLSVGGYREDGDETHRILLGAGIWIIEGLNLVNIQPGRYELICLPIKVEGSDGAPARALLRPIML